MRSQDQGRDGMHEAARAPQHDVPSPSANPRQEGSEGGGPQYRLRSPHIIEGVVVPAGTIVGEGTSYPTAQPSNMMEGANEAGKGKINEFHQRLYGADAPWHDPKRQRDVVEDRKEQEKQRKEEEGAEPVSHSQALERGKEWKGPPNPLVEARQAGVPPAGPSPITGDRAGGPGVSVPRTEPQRVERPLEEQLPKIG
jgi:hypothetical protein